MFEFVAGDLAFPVYSSIYLILPDRKWLPRKNQIKSFETSRIKSLIFIEKADSKRAIVLMSEENGEISLAQFFMGHLKLGSC